MHGIAKKNDKHRNKNKLHKIHRQKDILDARKENNTILRKNKNSYNEDK